MSPRQIMPGQLIHESVLLHLSQSAALRPEARSASPREGSVSNQSHTTPARLQGPSPSTAQSFPSWRARLPSGTDWQSVLTQYKQSDKRWIERDPYISAKEVVKDVLDAKLSDADRHVLVTLLSSGQLVRYAQPELYVIHLLF